MKTKITSSASHQRSSRRRRRCYPAFSDEIIVPILNPDWSPGRKRTDGPARDRVHKPDEMSAAEFQELARALAH